MSDMGHAPALVALLYLPVVAMALLTAIEAGTEAGWAPAFRLHRAYLQTAPAVRLAALGMAISAVVHLALAPAHLVEDPGLGVLFLLDGLALLAVAGWALTRALPGSSFAGVALLAAGVLAYAGYVASGAEPVDAVGVATKAVEVGAIALLAINSSRVHGGLSR